MRPRRLRLSLSAWRRVARSIDSRRSELGWRAHVNYYLSGLIHSLLFTLQNASHADKLKTCVPHSPLFVLGFWRSGTTLLHELFCCDPQFGFPSTYACLNPSHFLLTEAWSRSRGPRQANRPMDNMSYSWVSPQEDEFALLALGAPSCYEALIVPSLMRESKTLLDVRERTPEEQERWVNAFQSFLRLLTVQQGKTIVFKSPTHGFKLSLLSSMFPDSRYVVIERNPYEVFASNLKLWRTLLGLYALESVCAEEIESFVLEAYIMHEAAISHALGIAAPHKLAVVRYEDLVADPVREMKRLYAELHLRDFDKVQWRMEAHARSVAGHARNRFDVSSAQKARIEDSWGSIINAKGYTWPDQYLKMENVG